MAIQLEIGKCKWKCMHVCTGKAGKLNRETLYWIRNLTDFLAPVFTGHRTCYESCCCLQTAFSF